jgi:hypothetical protein
MTVAWPSDRTGTLGARHCGGLDEVPDRRTSHTQARQRLPAG